MKPIQHLLDKDSASIFSQVVMKAKRLEALSERLLPLLPKELQPHCRIAGLQTGRLLLIVDSPVWLTHLRFRVPELLDTLQKEIPWKDVLQIDVKVGIFPTLPTKLKPISKKPSLSSECLENFHRLMEKTTSSELKQALQQLILDTSHTASS